MERQYRSRDLLTLLAGLLLVSAGGSEVLWRMGAETPGGTSWDQIWPLGAVVLGLALIYAAWSEHDEPHAED
jgi:hypothetical protein